MVRNSDAGGGRETVDPRLERAVAGAQDRVLHRGEVLLGLVHGAGDAVGLEAVQTLGPLVAHRVGTEGEVVQHHADDAEEDGIEQARRGDQPAHEQARPGQDRAEQLARDGRALGDLARIVGFLRQNALARQEGGGDQQREGREVQRKPGRIAGEGAQDEKSRARRTAG